MTDALDMHLTLPDADTHVETAEESDEEQDLLSERLTEAIDTLKVSRAAATKVIQVADDPNASAKDLAASIELDPTFTAHIMRLANSAYYGMSGRIGNAGFAVTVIGFSTVRSLATLNATGLDIEEHEKPDGFWQHAAATAAAASEIAKQFGIPPSDAFAAGLMHDLGIALLHGVDATQHIELVDRYGSDGNALNAAERRTFGIGHDEAVGRILSHWRLPEQFVEAIRLHHSPYDRHERPFVTALRVADYLAEAAYSSNPQLHAVELLTMGLPEARQKELIEITRQRSVEVLASLPTGTSGGESASK